MQRWRTIWMMVSKQASSTRQTALTPHHSLPPLPSTGVDFWWNDEGETDYYTFYYWSLAQSDLLRSSSKPTQRFFSLSRAFSPGLARLGGSVWTGDIHPTWDALRNTPGLMLNWGLGGMPYVACDIGGFTGQSNALLLTRWYQLGVFLPIMRTHSIKQATPHWPWLWGEQYAIAMRKALELRYRLLVYHYSCAHAMMRSGGALWMRPLVAEFPDDPAASELTYEWLDGPSILAAPIVYESGNYSTYLPKGRWMEYNTTASHQGPITLQGDSSPLLSVPMFMRVPSIVPITPLVQHTGELPGGPLEVHVYSSSGAEDEDDGTTTFTVYEDDGETTDYLTRPSTTSREIAFAWAADKLTLTWVVTGSEAVPSGGFTEVSVVLLRPGKPRSVSSPWKIGRGGKVVF